ncbi:MAG: orotidine-5'-phosphate decarboxylase [Sandaracinaceae bacterium]
MRPTRPEDRLALALDVRSLADAERLMDSVSPHVGVFKVGLQLFIAEGPSAVHRVLDRNAHCFLDLKLHDIPATVAHAAASAAGLGARYLTLHASGGPRMLEAARHAVEGSGTQLLAVTVLTSHDDAELQTIGLASPAAAQALAWARLAIDAGIDGFVCSPEEVAALRALAPSATLVTPGVRPAGSELGDQRRVATPGDAIRSGADVLVVGRPIRDASDLRGAASAIVDEIARAAA